MFEWFYSNVRFNWIHNQKTSQKEFFRELWNFFFFLPLPSHVQGDNHRLKPSLTHANASGGICHKNTTWEAKVAVNIAFYSQVWWSEYLHIEETTKYFGVLTMIGMCVCTPYVQVSVITQVCTGILMGSLVIRTVESSVAWREKPLCLQTIPKLPVIGSFYLT